MKLHLPSRLRAAVLACMSALTIVGTTLATGTLAGGALVAVVGTQAYAADYTITTNNDGNLYTATADDTVTVNLTSGFLAKPDGGKRISANLIIENMILNNGYGSSAYEFDSAKISGAGAISYNSDAPTNQHFNFNGCNMSEYTGEIDLTRAGITLSFHDVGAIGASSIKGNIVNFTGEADVYAGPGFLDTRLTHVLLALSQGSAYHLTEPRTIHHEQPYT